MKNKNKFIDSLEYPNSSILEGFYDELEFLCKKNNLNVMTGFECFINIYKNLFKLLIDSEYAYNGVTNYSNFFQKIIKTNKLIKEQKIYTKDDFFRNTELQKNKTLKPIFLIIFNIIEKVTYEQNSKHFNDKKNKLKKLFTRARLINNAKSIKEEKSTIKKINEIVENAVIDLTKDINQQLKISHDSNEVINLYRTIHNEYIKKILNTDYFYNKLGELLDNKNILISSKYNNDYFEKNNLMGFYLFEKSVAEQNLCKYELNEEERKYLLIKHTEVSTINSLKKEISKEFKNIRKTIIALEEKRCVSF